MSDGVHIAPLNPWLHIYFAVTGVNSFGAKVNADQQITRQEALRMFTRNNSWFLRMEDKIGTIEPGKLADLSVLDRDYFAVPDADIKKVRSVLTVVDGIRAKKVFAAFAGIGEGCLQSFGKVFAQRSELSFALAIEFVSGSAPLVVCANIYNAF